MDTTFLDSIPANVRLGVHHGRGISLRRPSWDCGWYWGFGYLGNRSCHFHLSGLDVFDSSLSNKNMYDQIKLFFGDSLTIKDDKALWKFCEIVRTIYSLKESAEVFGRGGSHFTSNPDAKSIKNPELVTHINEVLIPMQIRTLYQVLQGSMDSKEFNR